MSLVEIGTRKLWVGWSGSFPAWDVSAFSAQLQLWDMGVENVRLPWSSAVRGQEAGESVAGLFRDQ